MCTLSSSHKNKIYKDLFRPFVMDVQIAERLVSALEKRPMTGVVPDKALFLDVLLSTDVPESSRFYEVVPDRPDKRQLVQETGRYSYFSLRRVMRNRNALGYQSSDSKNILDRMASALGVYSSDALTRSMRADRKLVGMMTRCEEPFSLLGKL